MVSADSKLRPMLSIYKKIYQCENCSALKDPMGVSQFVQRGPLQTVAVSHFGDISNAMIWLILTNPKGDRSDPNVDHLVSSYGDSKNRQALTEIDVENIFSHFSKYFRQMNIHSFFHRFMALLNGLTVSNQSCSFQNGGICAVDVIKCPTVSDWQQIVRSDEGKTVWHNCLGKVRTRGPNHFLTDQITLHKPCVLIFAQSTNGLIGAEYKGFANNSLKRAINPMVEKYITNLYSLDNPKRLSIALCSSRQLNCCFSSPNNLKSLHITLQEMINKYF